jgi:hypothetical protein
MQEDNVEGLSVSGKTKVKEIIKNNWGKRGLDEFGQGCLPSEFLFRRIWGILCYS